MTSSTAAMIHRTAIIADTTKIAEGVEVAPYAVIGPNVSIGKGTKIGAHAVIDGHTTIGEDCRIYAGASIGLEPQDLGYKGEPTGVVIGDRVTIREYATLHRATGQGFTQVGDDCFLMNYVHIAHNCKLGKGVILANSVMMAGHVTIDDFVVSSGMVIIHQHVRIGRMVMISGITGVRLDLPPFTMCDGRPVHVRGLNIIGLRRQKVGSAVRSDIKQAFRLLYRSNLNNSQALEKIEAELPPHPELQELVNFVRTSKRGIAGLLNADGEEKSGTKLKAMDDMPCDDF